MFEDAKFYSNLAEDSRSYGRAKCSECTMFLAVSRLDFDDDLLTAMENAEDYLIDPAA